jgi:hypothetical protein
MLNPTVSRERGWSQRLGLEYNCYRRFQLNHLTPWQSTMLKSHMTDKYPQSGFNEQENDYLVY